MNDAPSFTKGTDQTVNEDAGPQTVNPWATAIDDGEPESTQALTFNIMGNTNPSLFSAGPSVSPTGALTYTPAANASGTANLALTLSDDGGTDNGGDDTSDSQTFTITVNAVNDAPAFSAGPNQSVDEDSGAQSVSWASGISPGPTDESGQTVSFSVTGNTNPSLFSAPPAISSSGVLTYTPAANAFGSATITLILSDNGGHRQRWGRHLGAPELHDHHKRRERRAFLHRRPEPERPRRRRATGREPVGHRDLAGTGQRIRPDGDLQHHQ